MDQKITLAVKNVTAPAHALTNPTVMHTFFTESWKRSIVMDVKSFSSDAKNLSTVCLRCFDVKSDVLGKDG